MYENIPSTGSIYTDLPSQAGREGTDYYHTASGKLLDMLKGATPCNLKEAVFLVENAYFEGQLDRSAYNNSIRDLGTLAKQKARQDGYNWNNPVTKNIMLFRVMSDTLKIKSPLQEGYLTSYPMRYDFEDFRGEKDWSKMFVTKLLATHKGQCHSLPLLYLILCESVGAEASIAYSPSHSYITFKDQKGNWYNLELTNGKIVSDAFIAGSGFVSAEAIRNGTYMAPQSPKQVIAECLSDLAMGYAHKFGYDGFVNQCVDSVLKYDPKNLMAWMVKSNYQTVRFEYVVNQVGRPHPDILKSNYPEIYRLLTDRNETYRRVDASGHREMPPEVYSAWLKAVEAEKEKRSHEEKYQQVIQFIK